MKNFKTPTALVLINLGTPEECTTGAIRKFLKQFLWDSRVVEIPRIVWWCILNLFVLTFRPRRIKEAYQIIWTERGSPLRFHTEDQVKKLQLKLNDRFKDNPVTCCYAMTYGAPSIDQVFTDLYESGHRRFVILPMYPQYSGSTTGAIYDQIADYMKRNRALPSLQIIQSYFYHSSYIKALSGSIEAFWQENGRSEKLLFSYHGIPESYVNKGDPYQGHCECTTGATAAVLSLDKSQYKMAFQSRFGKAKWIEPYTEATIIELAKSGVKTLDVVCPAFAADCLETIEEIAVQNRQLFIEHGGEDLRLISCLNASDRHIDALEDIATPYLLAIN